MANLIRWDPFREMNAMREMMDRVFDRDVTSPTWSWDWSLALDVIENPDRYVVKDSLPGIHPDDIEITYNDRVLTIKGEVKEDSQIDEARYHVRERRFGSFSRSINLPNLIEADKIQATYNAGILTLELPKTEEAQPRRIAVQSADKILEG